MSNLRFESNLTMDEIENNFKDIDFFSSIMDGLQEAVAYKRCFYPAVFTYEDGKEISVEFPDLGCATSGENDADALRSARELLGLVISGLLEDGEALPAPTPLYLIPLLEHQRSALVAI